MGAAINLREAVESTAAAVAPICGEGKVADYMLIDRPDAVVSFDVVYDPEVSDHCPLILEV